jgi:hypothetical protein
MLLYLGTRYIEKCANSWKIPKYGRKKARVSRKNLQIRFVYMAGKSVSVLPQFWAVVFIF